ncbi:MAG: O-antigen polymerase [Bacteroidota bacterium]
MNLDFIKKYNLVRTTLIGLLFWIALFILFPLKVKYELSLMAVLFILFNYVFFLLGLTAVKSTPKHKEAKFTINILVLKHIMKFIIVLALLGFILKVLDKFYIRETSFDNTMSENRVLLEKSGPSVISIISAIINPLSFIPLFIYYYIGEKNRWVHMICIFLFFSASLEFIVLGSRSGLFILLILFGLYLFFFKRIKLTPSKLVIIGVILFSLGTYSINLFIKRTTDFTKSDEKSVRHILTRANYNFTIEPTEKTKNAIIESKNGIYRSSYLGLTNFVQYYLHGMYEFGYLYDNYDSGHHYGAFTFNIFAKFSNIILRTNFDLEKIQKSPPRTGIYTTFFGPIFVDFGWISLIFMFFFGVFQKAIYNRALMGRIQYIPLLFYFLIINFFFPVINFLNGAQGLYTISAFILFAIIYTLLSGKIIVSKKDNKIKYVRILKLIKK